MIDSVRPQFDFSARCVLVTGGTSGIGAASVEAFVKSGARVVFTGRNPERAQALLERLRPLGEQAHFIGGDLTDPEFALHLLSQTRSLVGTPDIVVNSAGVIHHAIAEETTDRQWRETFDVNVFGTFCICRVVIPAMRERGGGVIVNVASDAAISGSEHLVAYCASKGAVLQMTRAMALDHARDHIRVVAVCPGDVDTPMLRGEYRDRGISPEQGLAESATAVPLNRVCTVAEIADMILFAASDSARFMTGTAIVADGGSNA